MKSPLLFALLIFLSGCTLLPSSDSTPKSYNSSGEEIAQSPSNPQENTNDLKKRLLEAREKEAQKANTEGEKPLKTASLVLETKESTAGKITVSVMLKNPKQEPITSLQSWVSYPKEILSGESLTLPQNSPFTLVAPGEKDFDTDMGIAKIGVSLSEGKTFADIETEVATISFTRKKEGMASLEFFNPGDEGQTRIMSITKSGPQNILDEKQVKSVIIP
ncbi:MAG: hypothetical protein WCJ84_01105 [Candidatus Peregrinibacteria bacterium]